MILAQYYNFIRLGREGYTRIQNAMRENARYLAKGIAEIGKFDILHGGELTPSCISKLKDESKYNGCRSYIYNSINNLQAHYRWYVTHCL